MGLDGPVRAEVLLRRCQRGDERAWAELVKSFATLVYSTARQAGLQSNDAEDVFQHTFLALYRNLDRIEDARRLVKWIAVTASREAIRISKQKARFDDTTAANALLDEVIRDDERSAEELLVASSQSQLAIDGLEQLQESCKNLLQALFEENPRPYDEIAAELGISIGSIGPTRARCIEKLRRILAKVGFFESSDVSGLDDKTLRVVRDVEQSKR